MRCLLLFPPHWIPFGPHLAGPAMLRMLKMAGHDARFRDLNADFYNSVLSRTFLSESVNAAFADFRENAPDIFRRCPHDDQLKDHPPSFQKRYRRYRQILRIAERQDHEQVIDRVDAALAVLRGNDFYEPEVVDDALTTLQRACEILSAAYAPSQVYFLTPSVKIYYQLEALINDCLDDSGNIFRKFLAPRIADILRDDPDFIGITIGDYSQLLAGLTLAMLLRQATRAHICIGGNLFGRHTDVLINQPEFFRRFADFVVYNEGERPAVELLEYIEGRRDIVNVSNLIYPGVDDIVRINDEAPPYALEQLGCPDFSDTGPSDYFLPSRIFNLQASRSCYWRKCSFCTHHQGSRYAVKSVAQIVDEIESLQHEHGAAFFHFVDEAISPATLRKLSEEIIARGLDINFYLYARFERAFDRELFDIAYRAGLRMILWGFETANERVYRLMNKGVVAGSHERREILASAHASGIWNFLFLMFGFPTERIDEAKETVDFVRDNRHMLSHGMGSTFQLVGNSPMLDDLAHYAITSVEKVRNGFNFAHRYTTSRGMSAEQKKTLEAYKNAQWRLPDMAFIGASFREKLFLYVCRFGVARISEMNARIWL